MSGLLFNATINADHFPNESTSYADDINYVCAVKTGFELTDKVNLFYKWTQHHLERAGLTLQPNKTTIMIRGRNAPPSIEIGHTSILTTNSAMFLGVKINKDLCMNDHILNLLKRIGFAHKKIRQFALLTISHKKCLFKSLVLPLIRYGAESYGPYLTKKQKSRLQIACNKVIRTVFNIPWKRRVSLTRIRNANGILSVANILDESLMREAWKKRNNFILLRGANAPDTRSQSQRIAAAPISASKYDQGIVKHLNQMSSEIIQETRQTAAFSKIKRIIQDRGRPPERNTHAPHLLMQNS